MDLGQLEGLLKRILGDLDHQVLNDIPGLEKPTFENILLWVGSKMKAEGVSSRLGDRAAYIKAKGGLHAPIKERAHGQAQRTQEAATRRENHRQRSLRNRKGSCRKAGVSHDRNPARASTRKAL